MHSDLPLISVIIPTYNVEKYIQETIESVLKQTFQLFEIIIIDDGSTDDTVNVISSVNDYRIKVVRLKNSGVSVARNVGISMAKGDYVAFLDGDDIWKPNHLEKAICSFKQNPDLNWYSSSFKYFSDISECELFSDGQNVNALRICKYFPERMKDWSVVWTSAVVIKKSCISSHLFPPGISNGEDEMAWATVAAGCPYFLKNDDVTVYYRRRPFSLSCNIHTSSYIRCESLLNIGVHYSLLFSQYSFDKESHAALKGYIIYAWEQCIIANERILIERFLYNTAALNGFFLKCFLLIFLRINIIPHSLFVILYKILRRIGLFSF